MIQIRLRIIAAMIFVVQPALAGSLWAQNALPEGEAKEAVQAMCVQCHQIGRVTGMHLSREDWKNAVEDMVRMGAQIPPDWVDPIVDYLALNFPEKSAAGASGAHDVDVSMEIVHLPTEAHQALPDSVKTAQSTVVAPDGTAWFSLAASNEMARLRSGGLLERIRMPRPRVTPVAGTLDPRGTPFFVERGSNRILSINPTSMTAREYALPNTASRPQAIAIDADGLLWELDDRGFVGRLDLASGTFQEWPWPQGHEPSANGLAVFGGGVWTTQCVGTICSLMRFAPTTGSFQTWPMPDGVTSVTHLVSTAPRQLTATAEGSDRAVIVTVTEKAP